jgi:hypothetical protein
LIKSKRQAIEQYDPSRYRTLRDRLNNEAIRLTEKMNEALSAARQRTDGQQSEIATDTKAALLASGATTQERSWFAFVVLVALELLNLFAHRYERGYLAKVEKEGIEFGALEASTEQTAYEIQLARLKGYLHQSAQANGLQLPGYAPGPMPAPAPAADRPKVGFRLPWEQAQATSLPARISEAIAPARHGPGGSGIEGRSRATGHGQPVCHLEGISEAVTPARHGPGRGRSSIEGRLRATSG